ncbi:gamma-glutamyl-gamma-aminobutyrate hydrolase family protein [Streptomyces sp. NPDC051109]|uniref:gamma-glutamyl-gamma-aminobutyrate hydrolase family protein n=1 Tax=Streptomyces sp. NPDC051109 TaxID=3365642 RepID=UPI003795CCAC
MSVRARETRIPHPPDSVGHHGHDPYGGHFCAHAVTTVPGTPIRRPPPGDPGGRDAPSSGGGSPWSRFTVAARAADGIVEAVESTRRRFAVGVQWRPETGVDAPPVHAWRLLRVPPQARSGGLGGRTESAHGAKFTEADFPDTGVLTPLRAPIRITA